MRSPAKSSKVAVAAHGKRTCRFTAFGAKIHYTTSNESFCAIERDRRSLQQPKVFLQKQQSPSSSRLALLFSKSRIPTEAASSSPSAASRSRLAFLALAALALAALALAALALAALAFFFFFGSRVSSSAASSFSASASPARSRLALLALLALAAAAFFFFFGSRV